jgi:hypothetical protein
MKYLHNWVQGVMLDNISILRTAKKTFEIILCIRVIQTIIQRSRRTAESQDVLTSAELGRSLPPPLSSW